VENKILFSRGVENLQLREKVEAEAQMLDPGQIQQKIMLKSCNRWLLIIYRSFYVKNKAISATM